jgi:hypothetical protein
MACAKPAENHEIFISIFISGLSSTLVQRSSFRLTRIPIEFQNHFLPVMPVAALVAPITVALSLRSEVPEKSDDAMFDSR